MSTLMLGGFAFQAPLLGGLFTARTAVWAREVGGAQMEEDGIVGRGVAGLKCKVRIVELVAAM